VYHAARRAVYLDEPAWTTAGEILNRQRVRIWRRTHRPENARFTARETEPLAFARMTAFLANTARGHGFAYKDVLQPFVVADWEGLADFRVLKVTRDVAEVAYSMLNRQWRYPEQAADLFGRLPWSLVEGLIRAEAAIASLPGETIDYAEAIESHDALAVALRALYPDGRLGAVRYIDERFARTRRQLEARRHASGLFHEVMEAVELVRATLGVIRAPGETAATVMLPELVRPAGEVVAM
jgi:hypothetical protein